MKSYKTNKPGKSGRNELVRWVRLDHSIMNTPAYRSLSPNARSLLFEIIKRHNLSNNGSLWLSVRDAAALMGVVDLKAASAAFNELETMGFIMMTSPAHFSVKASDTSRARCWALTWEHIPCLKRGPAHQYREAKPQSERARKRAAAGLEADARWRREVRQNRMPVVDAHTMKAHLDGIPVVAVVKSNTANTANGAIPLPVVVGHSPTHIATRGRGISCWWTNPIEHQTFAWASLMNSPAILSQKSGTRHAERC